MTDAPLKRIPVPFTVVRDHRESRGGWTFDEVRLVRRGEVLLADVDVVTRHMKTGDYTIEGMEDRVTIERKSIADLAGTLTRGRRRFVAELERMRTFEFSAVVVEGPWLDLIHHVRDGTYATAQSVQASLNAFIVRYPTQWLFRSCPRAAETTALQLMIRWWTDKSVGQKSKNTDIKSRRHTSSNKKKK